MQVINITHLPQVASKGDTHFRVYKETSTTKIELLSPQQRIEEIAQMLSGNAITDAACIQAAILLGSW
jgi:DNA repair protein RecN (Recombination protein N)